MKFRVEKNTVEFRLTPDEIGRFSQEHTLSDILLIDRSNKFEYTLSSSGIDNNPKIQFSQTGVKLIIPQQKVDNWINSNNIGIREKFKNADGEEIIIVVEEDLPRRKKKDRSL